MAFWYVELRHQERTTQWDCLTNICDVEPEEEILDGPLTFSGARLFGFKSSEYQVFRIWTHHFREKILEYRRNTMKEVCSDPGVLEVWKSSYRFLALSNDSRNDEYWGFEVFGKVNRPLHMATTIWNTGPSGISSWNLMEYHGMSLRFRLSN